MSESKSSRRRSKVAYVYNAQFGQHHLGSAHPMKPHRVSITDRLVSAYGLAENLCLFEASKASHQSLAAFHDSAYLDFLNRVDPKYHLDDLSRAKQFCSLPNVIDLEAGENLGKAAACYSLGDDCPIFYGIYDFARIYAGGTLKAASLLLNGDFRVAINWSGGLHHAKKSAASGFCYVNDIVLAIQLLLQRFSRIFYIDIDVHHGDGVQDAFYFSDRVLSLSLHGFGNSFFPGTGSLCEIGHESGLYHSLNVPLRTGVIDSQYLDLFKSITNCCVERYRPECIVLQCGSDSLAGDILGRFNLSIEAHGECVKHIRDKNLPTLVLGGGGYKISNVSRCWTYETSILMNEEISTTIPDTEYNHYFLPSRHLLRCPVKPEENHNSQLYIDAIKEITLEQLKNVEIAPNSSSTLDCKYDNQISE